MSNTRIVIACSGASNLGQITNSVAVKMQERETGQMSCLAALGADVSSYVKSAKESELIVLDGCSVECSKKIVSSIGIENYNYFVISDLLSDIKKMKEYHDVNEYAEKAYKIIIDETKVNNSKVSNTPSCAKNKSCC